MREATSGEAGTALGALRVADLAGVLGYAEGLALMTAGLGVWADPAALVRWCCVATAGGTLPWDPAELPLLTHLRQEVLAWLVAQVDFRAEAAERVQRRLDGARLSQLQLGRLSGVLVAARANAARLAEERRTDPAVLDLATALRDELRRAVAVTDAGVPGAPRDVGREETAPVRAGATEDGEGRN